MENKRYKAIISMSPKGYPIYPVVDIRTGEWICVKDCFYWSERVAEKMNMEFEKASESDEQKEHFMDEGV